MMMSAPTQEPTLEPTSEPTFDPTFQPSVSIPSSKTTLSDRLGEPRVLFSLVAAGALLSIGLICIVICCRRKFRSNKVVQVDEDLEEGQTLTRPDKDTDSPDDFTTNPPAPISAPSESKEGVIDLSLPSNLFSAIHSSSANPKYDGSSTKKDEEQATPSIQDDHISYADTKEGDDEDDKDSLISVDEGSTTGVKYSIRNLISTVSRVASGGNDPLIDETDNTIMDLIDETDNTITNNAVWYEKVSDGEDKLDIEQKGTPVYASLGGHITKFDDHYYWVGTDPRPEDSSNRIYRSETMGSNTWELYSTVELKLRTNVDDGPKIKPPNENTLEGKPQGRRNCTLLRCPKGEGYYVIYCKGVGIYKADQLDGTWSHLKEKTLDEEKLLEKVNEYRTKNYDLDPEDVLDHKTYHAGGMSAYYENEKAYLVISMRKKLGEDSDDEEDNGEDSDDEEDDEKDEPKGPKDPRYALILEMTDDFLEVARVILWKRIESQREALWLFKRESTNNPKIWKYYLSYDGPGGWEGSDTFYRVFKESPFREPWEPWVDRDDGTPEDEDEADHLINNQDGPFEIHDEKEERQVIFEPEIPRRVIDADIENKRKDLRSFASQHRYFMQVPNGQWIYGGDRYPHHEPESHKWNHGYHIMCPVKWDNDVPTVICEKIWDTQNYNPDSETAGWSLNKFRRTETNNWKERRQVKAIMKSHITSNDSTSIGICTMYGVFLITYKKQVNRDESSFGMVCAGNETHYRNLVVTEDVSVTKAVEEMSSTMYENPQSHCFSLLIGGVEVNSDEVGTPHLYHLNPCGDPIKSKWDIAAIGVHAKNVTSTLKDKFRIRSDGTPKVQLNNPKRPKKVIFHALKAFEKAFEKIEPKVEMIAENFQVGYQGVVDDESFRILSQDEIQEEYTFQN